MNSDLQHLLQLQDLDLAVDRTRRQIADAPAVLAALDARLQDRTAAANAVRERIAAGQANRRETEKQLAEVQGRLSKYKNQLMEVKTNKEYQAMQHEIQIAEQHVREHEDRLLDRMEEAEALATELQHAEAALKAEQAAVAGEKALLDKAREAAATSLTELEAGRGAIAAKTAPAAVQLFEQISKHRRGIGLSEARDGLCQQCHVRLRPQVYNEVRRNEALIQCESCSRILYYVVPPAVPAPPSEGAGV